MPPNRSCTAFFLQPLKNYTANCWYHNAPIGINKLQTVVKVVCKKAGLPGPLFESYNGLLDEQVIQEITGHCSLVVRSYKRTCQGQRKIASCVLTLAIVKALIVLKHPQNVEGTTKSVLLC